MKICFVSGGHENLGIEYLSSLLKKAGHMTTLAFDPLFFNEAFLKVPFISNLFDYHENLIEDIVACDPDIVAFTVITEMYQWALQIASEVKRKINTYVIFGGVHPTLVPEKVISNRAVDFLCIGEGEYALLDLANCLEKNKLSKIISIPNLWIKIDGKIYRNQIRPLIDDLDQLPFPDKNLYYNKVPYLQKDYSIMASRGCPYNCNFCTNSSLRAIYSKRGKYLRHRSGDNVLAELVYAKQKYNIKIVSFHDDMFTFNSNWIMAFCRNYRQRVNLPFRCIIHPARVSREILDSLKSAGCVNMEIGVQSINEQSRKRILNRHESNEKLKHGLMLIKESGIGFSIDHILGIPFEEEKDHIEAVKYYNELRPPLIDVFWLTHYPKTKITEISRNAGLLSDEKIEELEEGRAKSIKHDGTVYAPKKFYPFQYLFGYLPLLPKRVINLILRKKWYRYFTFSSIFLSTILPRILLSFFWNDFRLQSLFFKHASTFVWIINRKRQVKS